MRKSLIAVLALAAGGYGAYRWQASEPTVTAQHDARQVKDRVWIDHIPQHERDTINVFVVLSKGPRQGPKGPIGAFEAVSTWKGQFEAFRHESHGEEMRIVFPHSGDRESLRVKPSKCNENGMDYCLEVSGSSRGVQKYYSRKGWEIRDLSEIESVTSALVK